MSRHRTRIPGVDESSSSSDSDGGIFASLSKKDDSRSAKRHKKHTLTSSNKRHHGAKTSTKQTKMDAVLEELQKSTCAVEKSARSYSSVPSKSAQGSFVDPDQERTTTNVFVGNLPLSINESILSTFFSRFGHLHSIKIMWPREAGHCSGVNGFVCFKERSAAEEAARYCRVNTCFGGRQLRTGWGKPILQPQQQPPPPPEHKESASQLRSGEMLSGPEVIEFREVVEHQLLAPSRRSICCAMAFCFDKSRAARHICQLLKELLLSECPVDTTIAQLFLLSDILYNSQQPGIRNAFLYRDALQQMGPSIFAHWRNLPLGRLGRERLSNAVSAVLAAWTNWGVYDLAYLDELEAAYAGRKKSHVVAGEKSSSNSEKNAEKEQNSGSMVRAQQDVDSSKSEEASKERSSKVPDIQLRLKEPITSTNLIGNETGGEIHSKFEPLDGVNGEPLENVDGEPLDDVDGEPLEAVDGELLEDVDGEPLEDVDGEPLESDEDIDGEPLEEGDGFAFQPLGDSAEHCERLQ